MSDQFVAEIRIFPFNFPPTGWSWCDGQLLPISQNTALFSLLGTNYGGDGKSTFGLPDLRGRAPMQEGQGPGLSERFLGETGGSDNVTLLQSEMPVHPHTLRGSNAISDSPVPTNNTLARFTGNAYQQNTTGLMAMAYNALTLAGGDQPHNNMQPYLTLYFCIALQGIFPPRG